MDLSGLCLDLFNIGSNVTKCEYCRQFFLSKDFNQHQQNCVHIAEHLAMAKAHPSSPERLRAGPGEEETPNTSFIPESQDELVADFQQEQSQFSKSSDLRKHFLKLRHDDFMLSIESAKEVQRHLAGGGNLSDLPPAKPLLNLDYVRCPHCMRRFNEAAAERHIPKCAKMKHNRPKAKQMYVPNGMHFKQLPNTIDYREFLE